MAVVWSNDLIMQLIKLFQSKALLWDTSRKEYKDKNKKNAALEEISQALNIPKKDVETKIHILRTQLTREKKKTSAKKIICSDGAGAIEKSKWIYYKPLQFLLCDATTSGESDTVNNNTVNENNVCQSDMELEPPSSSPTPTPNATTSTSSRKRNKSDDISEIFDIKKSAKKKMDEQEKPDSFDVYCAYIADELRSVKDDQAVTQAKYHINRILYELKTGQYNTHGNQTASCHSSSTQNNVQETDRREIESQEGTQDETEVSAKETAPVMTAHQPTMDFQSFAWCKPDWCFPSTNKETKKILVQYSDMPEVELSDNVDELIARSKAFPIPFPIENNRLETLIARRPIEQLKMNIVSTYPLIHERVLLLMTHFLIYKREFGSSIEKELYKNMGVPQLIDRILQKRAVAFATKADFYMLLSGNSGNGGWLSVGTENERPPLLLENCLSYDEMKVSALVYVSGHTECINDGKRSNYGMVNEEDIETHVVIIGVVAPRFERQFRMDYEDILITEEQNVPENGYSEEAMPATAQRMWRQMWADFYEVPSYTHEKLTSDVAIGSDRDAASKYIDRFVKLPMSSQVFDNEVYYKRISMLAETVLIEANARAYEAEKMAYVNITGAGLGRRKISEHQVDVYVLSVAERVRYLLNQELLQLVSKVNFAYITPSDSVLAMFSNSSGSGSKAVYTIFFDSERHPEGGITVQIQQREPSSKLTGEDEGKLLVMTYPWDENAHPGNELWFSILTGSGAPAAACSTQVPELHNAHINHNVCARTTRVVTSIGLHTLRVLIALSFYASGSYQRPTGDIAAHSVAQQTVSSAIAQVTDRLNLPHFRRKYIKFPTSPSEQRVNVTGFFNKFGIPGVLGCIGRTHVAIKRPKHHKERFYCRKQYYSLNVQVICNSDMEIISVDASNGGATLDAFIWTNHPLKVQMEELKNTWLLGDSGYPLSKTMMTPIIDAPRNSPEAYYNELHVRTRNVVEQTIGILKARFRCLLVRRLLHYEPQVAASIVNACVVLHNICNKANVPVQELDSEEVLEEAQLQPSAQTI